MNTQKDKSLILNEIKSAYNCDSDADFARFLGIPRTTLSTWRNRNSLDYELLYSKCDGLSGDFLLGGGGAVKRVHIEQPADVAPSNDVSLYREIIELQKKVIKLQDEINFLGKRKAGDKDVSVRGVEGELKQKV